MNAHIDLYQLAQMYLNGCAQVQSKQLLLLLSALTFNELASTASVDREEQLRFVVTRQALHVLGLGLRGFLGGLRRLQAPHC